MKNQDLLRPLPSPMPMGHRASDCGVYSLMLVPGRSRVCGRGSEEMATADPGTMFSMLAGEMEAGAGLYCLGRDMRNTTSLLLCLGSAASAAL